MEAALLAVLPGARRYLDNMQGDIQEGVDTGRRATQIAREVRIRLNSLLTSGDTIRNSNPRMQSFVLGVDTAPSCADDCEPSVYAKDVVPVARPSVAETTVAGWNNAWPDNVLEFDREGRLKQPCSKVERSQGYVTGLMSGFKEPAAFLAGLGGPNDVSGAQAVQIHRFARALSLNLINQNLSLPQYQQAIAAMLGPPGSAPGVSIVATYGIPLWQSSQAYAIGSMVRDSLGNVYVGYAASSSAPAGTPFLSGLIIAAGTSPASNPGNWSLIAAQGNPLVVAPWAAMIAYPAGALVAFDGNMWVTTAPISATANGSPPPQSAAFSQVGVALPTNAADLIAAGTTLAAPGTATTAGQQAAAAVVAGTALNTGSAGLLYVDGGDTQTVGSHRIRLAPAGTPTTGLALTVTFPVAFQKTPSIALKPRTASAVQFEILPASITKTGYTLNAIAAPTASVLYDFDVSVVPQP